MTRSLPNCPTLTVVGGPNGSGKSTFVAGLGRRGFDVGTFVNPDVIARSLQDSDQGTKQPTNLNLAAGRETLRLARELIAQRQSFTRETTLTSKEILRTMQAAKEAGYEVTLIFIGVETVETSKDRVRTRVEDGGHDIPEDVQERRFEKSFQNAPRAARIADRAYFFHNGDRGHELVAEVENGRVIKANLGLTSWLEKAITGLERAELVEDISGQADEVRSGELEAEQVTFITSVLPNLIELENAARQYGEDRLRGTFAVAVTEATPEGSLYEVTEGERLLFSATVRDRQIVRIPVFNLASDELEGVRSRLAMQKQSSEDLLQQRQAENEFEP